MWASVDPTRPQPMITMCTAVPPDERDPRWGCLAKGMPSECENTTLMNYQTGQVVELTTVEVAQGGWCVARPADGPVLFVRHALPGERVLARVTEVTSRLVRAEAVEILAASPDRVEPPCPHARPGGCGGCDWQHATLPAQRALKAAVIRQQLRRIAGLDREVTVEALGDLDGDQSPAPGLGWRTRVQFAVRDDGVAGLRAHRSHRIID